MHLKLRRAACWVAGIVALVVALPQSSHGEEFPGLPDAEGIFGQSWGGAAQGGISYASRAKQWFRSPDSMVTFRVGRTPSKKVGDCAPLCVNHYQVAGQAFMVSPEGAPADYGYLAPMTVRSVGFGLMPVEATVQVSQRRENGLPIPFESWLSGEDHYDFSVQPDQLFQIGHSVRVEDAVNVQILEVLVDGVDLGLTGDCRTVTPAPLAMASREYTIPLQGVAGNDQNQTKVDWFRHADPDSFFHPDWGGTLHGTITIPPFTGCTTASGDDLSALMTLSVSGPDNPVAARVGWVCYIDDNGANRPLAVGENTPKRASAATVDQPIAPSGDGRCNYGTKKLEYPARSAD